MSLPVQLRGNLKLGAEAPLTDVKDYVSEMRIIFARDEIEVPGTLGKPKGKLAGDSEATLRIRLHSGFTVDSIWSILYAAIMTPASELLFEGSFDPGAISASNMQWEGTVVVLGLETGAEVGALRQQTLDLPIKPGTLDTKTSVGG